MKRSRGKQHLSLDKEEKTALRLFLKILEKIAVEGYGDFSKFDFAVFF